MFSSVVKVGLPIAVGVSIFKIPIALNDSSRSFYSDDDEIAISPLFEQEQKTGTVRPPAPVKQAPTSSTNAAEITTKYVQGYKINSSGFLETHFKELRAQAIQQLNLLDAEFQNLKSASKNEYHNVKSNILSLYEPKDQFLPSAIYALTLTLSGSILANRSSFPVRTITPLVFATIGFKFFLPGTFEKTVDAIKSWESQSYPEVLQAQTAIKNSAKQLEYSSQQAYYSFNQSLIETIHSIRSNFK